MDTQEPSSVPDEPVDWTAKLSKPNKEAWEQLSASALWEKVVKPPDTNDAYVLLQEVPLLYDECFPEPSILSVGPMDCDCIDCRAEEALLECYAILECTVSRIWEQEVAKRAAAWDRYEEQHYGR